MDTTLFPTPVSSQGLVGIAKLAAEGQSLSEGHNVEYFDIDNRSILTRCLSPRMPFTWMINPYRGCEFACKYCYARYTHEFMEMRDGTEFERKIYVKQHAGWLLRQELKKVRADEQIAIGTATDPYQPAERRFQITRSLLEEFSIHQGLTISMVTKSDLVLRDLDLLKTIARHNKLTICITVTTVNTELARSLEPRAPRPDLRLKAVRRLVESGVYVGVNCAPVLPGITDSPADLERLVRDAAMAEAAFVWTNALFLKPCAEKIFMPFLEEKFPRLVPLYKERYSKQAYLPPQYHKRISALVRSYCEKHGIRPRNFLRPESLDRDGKKLQSQLDLFATLQPRPPQAESSRYMRAERPNIRNRP